MGEMRVRAQLQGGERFAVETPAGQTIVLDNVGTAGEEMAGPSPMMAVLAGLAGCAGMSVIAILRKKRQDVHAYEVRVWGRQASVHPHVFTEIEIEHHLTGQALSQEAVARAIELTEERYCPVSAMLAATVRLHSCYEIHEA